jgi:hypothetical protein
MRTFTPTKATGSHFYRYQSAEHLERLKTVIVEHLLYVPSVGQLKDPIDCRPKISPMSEEEMVKFLRNDYIRRNPVLALDLLQAEEQKIRGHVQRLGVEWFNIELSKIMNAQMEHFRIYSMTKRFDNFGLWAKYAADHTGYCLEFANEGPLFEKAWEVSYGEYPPFDVNDQERRDALFLVYKRRDWSSEEEVRLILPRAKGTVVHIEPCWLTRIILGMKMQGENERQICEWAAQRQPQLTVGRAYLDGVRQEIRLKG